MLNSLSGAASTVAAATGGITSAGIKKLVGWIALQLVGTAILTKFIQWFSRVSGTKLPSDGSGWQDALAAWMKQNPEQNVTMALGQLEALKSGMLSALQTNPSLVQEMGDSPEARGTVLENAAALARQVTLRSGDGEGDTVYGVEVADFTKTNAMSLEEYRMVQRLVQLFGSVDAAEDVFYILKTIEESAFDRFRLWEPVLSRR